MQNKGGSYFLGGCYSQITLLHDYLLKLGESTMNFALFLEKSSEDFAGSLKESNK